MRDLEEGDTTTPTTKEHGDPLPRQKQGSSKILQRETLDPLAAPAQLLSAIAGPCGTAAGPRQPTDTSAAWVGVSTAALATSEQLAVCVPLALTSPVAASSCKQTPCIQLVGADAVEKAPLAWARPRCSPADVVALLESLFVSLF